MSGDGYAVGTDLAGLGKDKVAQMDYFDIGLMLTIFLLVISVVLLVLFGVWTIIKFPKSLKSTLIFRDFYLDSFSSYILPLPKKPQEDWGHVIQEFKISDGVNNFISAGLWSMIILCGALVMMVEWK